MITLFGWSADFIDGLIIGMAVAAALISVLAGCLSLFDRGKKR